MYVLPWKNWIIGDFRGETPHFGEWAGASHPPTPQNADHSTGNPGEPKP
jgi:hypothetical protein